MAGWCSIEVNELRELLGVPKSYQWNDFQRQVLDIAKSELKEHAKIEMEIERTKTGRKITHLKFIFAENENIA